LLSPDTSESSRSSSALVARRSTGPETNVACACMGFGLIQVPRYRVSSELASGALVEVLPAFRHRRYPSMSSNPPAVATPAGVIFIEWMAEQFRERLSSAK
jgi:DNA-binding transcriptional LysR family regulator